MGIHHFFSWFTVDISAIESDHRSSPWWITASVNGLMKRKPFQETRVLIRKYRKFMHTDVPLIQSWKFGSG